MSDDQPMTPAAIVAAMRGDMDNAKAAMAPGGIEEQERRGRDNLLDREVLPRMVQIPNLERPRTGSREDAFDPLEGYWKEAALPDWEDAVETLGSIGFEVGDIIDRPAREKGDETFPLFVEVDYPEGWEMVSGTAHRGIVLVDENNLCRAHLFYKAAYYDRKADIRFKNRIYCSYIPYDRGGDKELSYEVRFRNKRRKHLADEGYNDPVLARTEPIPIRKVPDEDRDMNGSWVDRVGRAAFPRDRKVAVPTLESKIKEVVEQWADRQFEGRNNIGVYWSEEWTEDLYGRIEDGPETVEFDLDQALADIEENDPDAID